MPVQQTTATEMANADAHLDRAKKHAVPHFTGNGDRSIRLVGVVGAGTMGIGIAMALSRSGFMTILVDSDKAALERAESRIRLDTENALIRNRLSAQVAHKATQNLQLASSIDALNGVELVIEAAFERLAVKQQIMAALDTICSPNCILATNTSTLDIDKIADVTSRPDHVIGLHFFSPAHVMPLVEIVRGSRTSTDVINTSRIVVHALAKVGIVVGNCYGFAGNRMVEGMGREANMLLLEGNPPEAIDAALRGFGMAMGPLEVADLVGIDVPYQARVENSQALPGDAAYYRMNDLLVGLGWLGQKSGQGFYCYEPGDRRGRNNPEIVILAKSEAERLGISQALSSPDEIIERCIFTIINEGANVLGEGIAGRASDLDLIHTLGYGFPTSLGGPMHFADTLGLSAIVARLRRLQAAHGNYWAPAPLIESLGSSGSSFAEYDRSLTG